MRTIRVLALLAAIVLLSGCYAAQPRGMGFVPIYQDQPYYVPPINTSQTIYLR